MSWMDKVKGYVRGTDYVEDDYIDEEEEEVYEEEESAVRRRKRRRETEAEAPAAQTESTQSRERGKVVDMPNVARLSVVLVKPDRYEAAAEIADHLKEMSTVVLNLEQTNREIARRLLDFLSGVAYAKEGKIKKVANSTYIITPYGVDLQGDLIDELESNGLYL